MSASVSSGGGFSCFVGQDSKVYVSGTGHDGQHGNGYMTAKCKFAPLPIENCNVYTVSCGENHAAALSSSHTLLTWGGGKYGQLGLGDNVKQISTPQTVQLPISLLIYKFLAVNTTHTH